MTTQIVIDNFLEEDQRLGNIIIDYITEIPFNLFLEWSSNRQKMGECLVDQAISFIAQKYNSYILSNPLNPSSYAHFLRSDVQSKMFSIRQRTIRGTMCSGFLDTESIEFGAKHLSFIIGGEQFFAVKRKENECLVRETNFSDIPLKVCCYEDGTLIVSDIDLISILSQDSSDTLLDDPTYGELNVNEKMMICELNQYFQDLINKLYPSSKSSLFRLIAHGPANRFSNSKSSHLHYPLKVYTPLSSIEFLGKGIGSESHREFIDFNLQKAFLGYHAHINPKWVF